MTSATHRTAWLAGCIPDLPTPFDDSDSIDLVALARLCERQIAAGCTAIVVGETAGEMATLTLDEHDAIVRAAVKTARGRVRVIAGAGSNSTSQAIELTRRSDAAGADAIMSVVPYYNKPMQSGISAHFAAVADCTELPIVLHDIPQRTMRVLADDTLLQLAVSPQFVGLRDGSGDITRPLRLRPLLRPGFRLLSGDDATAAGFATQGGDGWISMTAAVAPQLCRKLDDLRGHADLRSAQAIAGQLCRLTSALALDGTPAALKHALGLLGQVSARVRLPMVEPDTTAKATIAEVIAALYADMESCDVEHRLLLELSRL
ncbi:4-hydroxy-tetrahydrodipicolinate synthase [Rhodopseudomonas sp. P2A-2r]|uniref:4-hydroxy-tetrahydrodipicolinate synthase n=1 Tax=Rhodopseudomonas sp. P2A-2r TaxID=2991972 RepID=UPI0022344E31|nr:4-hydroxy-tetrahydrodipicolinate synthase [Rhodopseudomonas sp. P2A-2r]UZE46976.1 4-hydroxy-tetrahydrodipicolinate synthase [Rhodopseudomonas sp. P2A-2r]